MLATLLIIYVAIRGSIEDNVKYHLVVSPEIYFDPEIINTLYEYMERNLEVGLVMSKVVYTNDDTQFLM